jgi:hypothetical protein
VSSQGAGLTAYRLAFEISPIMLTNGIATLMPGGMLPIILLTEAANFVEGVLSGGGPPNLDAYFAHFKPAAGATMIANKVAEYPFANMAVAANAIIAQPLSVSMEMIVPAIGEAGAWTKLAAMTALQAALANHTNQGGLFIVATPTYFYTDCILTDMRCVDSGETKQSQYRWQLDFRKPLVSLQAAAQAQNNLMSKITAGLPTDGSLFGLGQTVNVPPSLATLSSVPAASGLSAAGTAPLTAVTSSPLPNISPG